MRGMGLVADRGRDACGRGVKRSGRKTRARVRTTETGDDTNEGKETVEEQEESRRNRRKRSRSSRRSGSSGSRSGRRSSRGSDGNRPDCKWSMGGWPQKRRVPPGRAWMRSHGCSRCRGSTRTAAAPEERKT